VSALAVDPVLMSATVAAFSAPYQDKHMVVRNLLGKMKCCYPTSIPYLTDALTGSCTEGFYCAFLLAALDALDTFKQNFEKNGTVVSAWFLEQQRPDFWTKIIGLFLYVYF
jgi:hypothetical protein